MWDAFVLMHLVNVRFAVILTQVKNETSMTSFGYFRAEVIGEFLIFYLLGRGLIYKFCRLFGYYGVPDGMGIFQKFISNRDLKYQRFKERYRGKIIFILPRFCGLYCGNAISVCPDY